MDHADKVIAGFRLRRNQLDAEKSDEPLTTKFDATTGESNATRPSAPPSLMDWLAGVLVRLGILTGDLDYHLICASMAIIFFFGYQKWWAYEAERLIPYISNRPLIFWLCRMRGATCF
jgi:hypothetical protein